MNTIIILSFVLYIFVIIYNKIYKFNSDYVYIKSKKDNNYYLVQKNHKNANDAADLLSIIRKNIIKLKKHLQNTYPGDIRIQKLNRLDTDNIVENESDSIYTSYTQNKGEKVVFCLRTKDNQNHLHDVNVMMFVAIHEMSHVITESIGHSDPEFWKNFAFLLKEAKKINVWKYTDYKKNPVEYCGMKITNSVI